MEERTSELAKANIQLKNEIEERKRADNNLKKAHKELETRIKERTSELSESNKLLSQEIGERMRVEEALRQGEKRYRKISELASDFAYAFRVEQAGDLSLEWIVGALERITGFTLDELRTRGLGQYNSP